MAAATPPASASATMCDSSGSCLTPTSQGLEDLACAYWQSDTLFAALELEIFGCLGEETLPVPELARIARCRPEPLSRLLAALARLNLVAEATGGWCNLPLTLRHLVPGRPEYLGDFLLYRRYLQPPWHGLAQAVADRPLPPALSRDDDYPSRNRHYVRALDQLARIKAREVVAALCHLPWRGPVLDIGGGAGAFSRALIQSHRQQAVHATLFDLPEVLAAARELYPAAHDWQEITPLGGEFISHTFTDNHGFGLIVFANFLHIYNQADARGCLAKAFSLLEPGGYLVIHEYCPDRGAVKGALYDLNMLINTADGRCHQAHDISAWLVAVGLTEAHIIDLPSDSTLIVARRPPC